jgi:KDO2-lipid IV(A) lauroyltransferase
VSGAGVHIPPSPAPERPGVADLLIGAVARGIARLPEPIAYLCADLLAIPVALFAGRHERRVAREGRGMLNNQRIAWRERWSSERSRRLTRDWARHVARLVVDVLRMPRITPANLERHVDVRDYERIRALAAEGRGVICVTGHIGVWEMCSHAARLSGLPVHVVARPLPWPPVERALARVRGASGQGALRRLLRLLRRGEIAGLLLDEDEPESPVFAPFLGTDAATSPVAFELQRRTGAPIAVVSCARLGRARFRFRVWRVIRPRPGDPDEECQRVVREMNLGLSEAILDAPAQWLWGSRRFRTRPPGERPGADGLPPVAVAHDSES